MKEIIKSKKSKGHKRKIDELSGETTVESIVGKNAESNNAEDLDGDGADSSKKKNKKKKKLDVQPGVPDSKMSKRQLKREKHAQRLAEAEVASHKAVQTQALSYLSLWKYNKAEWKFNKVKQIWLYKSKFDSNKVPDELWQPFLEYFAAASGSIKQVIINDSKKVIDEMEKWIEKNSEATNAEAKPSESAYKRARDVLQNIQE